MNIRPAIITLLGLSTLALSACNDPVKAPYGGVGDPLPANQYPQITTDGAMSNYLLFSQPVVSRDSGVLKVTTPARLRSDGLESNIQYRYIFLDASGQPLRAQPDWRYMRMPARQQVFFEGNALDATATDWRLEVRAAR